MIISLVFLSLLMALFGGWLFSHSINVRPWEVQGGTLGERPAAVTAPRVGLAVFLAVATSLFALTISAYMMRMDMGADWRSPPTPGLLWFNTALLVLGSVALQRAWGAARHGRRGELGIGLIAGGACSIAFVLGQGLVWWQLDAAGHYLAANPANAFFYLLTALHGLHLLGGLAVWARTLFRLRRGATPERLCGSVELCALYWHYLLVVWGILFMLVLST
ncbi:cytochrome c oxidase subunit 3 [Halomonas sp. M4R5S39]|uniref:cytochrome c oxidase subunit 3 n=1 Tax=Halomonas kalidii TaxID=3043293 RepID=UPI0024A842EB|nr:cytochrome c oxidase subunit 3 [Halomonas kalidii]MDI5985068.1 cytochrome c oxidase subunit 3 [Halomonas kalidii]